MTSLGSEIETLTSEDFGFKKLGQTTILPSYDEKLPFTSLQNLDISNHGLLYAACSKNKIVVGNLQQLREHIQNDGKTEISFIWEKEVDNVMAVKLIRDEKLIYVNKQSQIFQLDLSELGDPAEIFRFENELVHAKFWRNSILLVIDSNNQFKTLHLFEKQSQSLLDNVTAFDLFQEQLYVFNKSFSVQIYQLKNWNELTKHSEFSPPTELLDEIKEDYQPISINALSSREYQLVFGVPVNEEEDVSYDHKIFVAREIDNQMTFQESFDITPAFGSVIRYPIYYNERLSPLIRDIPQINILASSCSSEITIWDSDKVVQPLQDSERAVLPISKVTDNDTNPVGVALDVVTDGEIVQPCPGVDIVDKLPLIYILNNEGSLQIVGFYHASAIKEGNFDVKALKESIVKQEIKESIPFKESNFENTSEKQGDTADSLGGLSLGAEKTSTESKPFSESEKKSPSEQVISAPNESASEKSPFGQSSFSQSAFGQPTFGQSSFGQSAFGQPSFGQPSFGQPAFGQSSFGQSSFGKPSFGQSTFGQSTFGQSSFGSSGESTGSVFGKPSFGIASESSTSPFAKPSFGSSVESPRPVFGQTSFGKTESATGEEKGLAQENSSQSAFGKPKFGQISFGSTTNGSESGSAAFGKPSFGLSNNTGFGSFATAKEKSPFEASTLNTSGSSFGTFAKGQSNRGSPFASLAKKEDVENKPLFGIGKKDEDKSDKTKLDTAGPSKTGNSSISFTSNESKSPPSGSLPNSGTKHVTTPEKPTFSQSTLGSLSSHKKQSPFAAFAKDENLPVFTSPSYGTGKTRSSFSPSSTVPSSPTKQRFEPLVQKEDRKEKAIGNTGDDKKTEEQPGGENENIDKKNLSDNIDNLSDSTVEQTPARPISTESSISSLTAKIKESATLSSKDLKSPSINQQPKTGDGQSPFAQYTGDLNKPSSTGFNFSQVPNLNKGKDISVDNQVNSQIAGEKQRLPTDESSKEDESSENKVSVGDSKDSVSPHPVKETESNTVADNKLEASNDQEKNKDINSASSTVSNGASREDSYDTLDDITRGELENAGMDTDIAGQHQNVQQIKKKPEEGSSEKYYSDNNKYNVRNQPSPSVSVSTGTQVEKAASGDADCQTNPVEVTDFNVQTFEDDNKYLLEQYKPKPIPEYYLGANVTNIKYSSQDPILKSIEKTYHYVSAELSVLLENISGFDKFFEDQCLNHPIELDESSITNMYQWRIPDVSKLHTILNDKSGAFNNLFTQVDSAKTKMSGLIEENLKPLKEKLVVIRDEYTKLKKLDCDFQKSFGELRYHQLDKQSELRSKMFKTSETIRHIEELLQILKLYTVQGKQMEGNSYVVKLAREATDRENLLHEITRLREDIRDLNLKDERTLKPKKSPAFVTKEIQSIEVVQVGLKLNTKKQLGEMLKKRNNIETYL